MFYDTIEEQSLNGNYSMTKGILKTPRELLSS